MEGDNYKKPYCWRLITLSSWFITRPRWNDSPPLPHSYCLQKYLTGTKSHHIWQLTNKTFPRSYVCPQSNLIKWNKPIHLHSDTPLQDIKLLQPYFLSGRDLRGRSLDIQGGGGLWGVFLNILAWIFGKISILSPNKG